MELTQLRYLVAIADSGSFTRAAKALSLSQPSLSLAVKKLEDEIGHPLFDRLTRRVVPTEAGAQLLEIARRTLGDLDRSVCEIRELKGEVTGQLRIGAIPTVAPFILPEVIGRYSAKYPDVQLHVTETVTSRLAQMLEAGELDIAVTSVMPDIAGIHTELVGTEELYVIASSKHPFAKAKAVTWEQLEKEKFLVLGDEHCLAEQISWFCRKNYLSGRTMLEGAQLATIAALVSQGLGVSLVPVIMATTDYRGCVFRPFKESQPSRPLCLAWSVLRYRTQAGRKFMEMTRDIIGEMLQGSTKGGKRK